MQETLEFTVQKFTPKGYGVSTLASGQAVEIAHAIPGDRISASWKKKRHPPQKARLLAVLEPSPDRVVARCAHAHMCGGCCWQQMAYAAQLKEKEARVREAFGVPISPIIPCAAQFGYRNKMEFSFSENRGGDRYLGLMIAQAEPYVFNVTECHLGPSWFSEVLGSVRTWWEGTGLKAFHPARDFGTLRYLTLRHGMRTGHQMAVLNVSGNPDFALSRSQLDGFVLAVQRGAQTDGCSLFLRIHQTKKGTPTRFYEMHLAGPDHILEELHLKEQTLAFKISPSSFFQPNTLQAEVLYDTALALLPSDASVVFDLYCGTGTLGMAVARKVRNVVGIDLSPESILDAKENLQRNHISNVTFYEGDVGRVLTRLMERSDFTRPDAVIVDPPRAGLDPLALSHLKNLAPRYILYISCNPLTQASNVKELLHAGYRLGPLQPVDQFPHTYHIENIALLVRERCAL